MEEFEILGPERLTGKAEWRPLFSDEVLADAASPAKVKKTELNSDIRGTYMRARVTMAPLLLRTNTVRAQIYNVTISRIPSSLHEEWNSYFFNCSCRKRYTDTTCCVHVAAVLLTLEKARGGAFTLREDEWSYKARQREETRYRAILQQRREMTEGNRNYFPVSGILTIQQKGLVIYDLAAALREMVTNEWAARRAKEIRNARTSVQEVEARDGTRSLTASCRVPDDVYKDDFYASCTLRGKEFRQISCDCEFHEMEGVPTKALCPHELLLLQALRNHIQKEMPTDLTDDAAKKFFAHLHSAQTKAEKQQIAKAPERVKDVLLSPRIVVEAGEAQVSFKIGRKDGKMLVLRNLEALLRASGNRATFELSKTESLDFKKEDFAEEAIPWLTFIQRRVTELQSVNEKLYEKARWQRAQSLSITAQQSLTGAVLDQFYELANGKLCEYQDKSNNVKGFTISVGHTKMRFTLTIDQMMDTAGQFAGIIVSGMIPVMLEGASGYYILNSSILSRMEKREMDVLEPFRTVADASGLFRFRVGREHLQEFYYRVLPSLLDNPYVSIVDHCDGEPQKYLPPEPQFTFYLDVSDDLVLTCRCRVSYEEKQYDLNKASHDGGYRDSEQEARICQLLSEIFQSFDKRGGIYSSEMTDDSMYDFLMTGIARLEKYGDVHGTEAFKRRSVRRFSSAQVGVSLKSGLMDITLTARDYTQQELIGILESYQKKKRYYRLKSGDYVDLTENQELEDIGAFFQGLDLLPVDVLRKQIHLPLYRALYLDRMLEEHDSLVSTRDRTYRALIKNFQTIKDADYEVPSPLESVLRPYQTFGFKWLRTLQEAGFGGILADEMGLGKTVQMISLFQSNREEGAKLPSLVVCPASLVYNWQAEISRFAPGLKTQTVTGTTGVRKAILAGANVPRTEALPPEASGETDDAGTAAPEAPAPKKRGRPRKNAVPVVALDAVSAEALTMPAAETAGKRGRKAGTAPEAGGRADVYITSYDLLKRDIAEYEALRFSLCVLDEAQYIKNQSAAASKSVKLIRAEHRFALTGTPIENRLSELWSIFDFLMPGFLYRSEEFVKKFEIPISKNQNEEMTARLKKMVAPFILRRLKTDVLKDLPPKLEEVRYARFEGEQQKLYDAQVAHMKQMIHISGNTGEDKIKILAELTRIRQICCDPSLLFENYHGESAKRNACMELVQAAIDGGHRMLIFSQFTSMLALLEEDLKAAGIDCFKITGATPKETRISLVNQFNDGDVPVFLVSLKAGGTGLNLTGADVVIHYDPWWNLAAQNQATDRAHRIGQTRQVTVYKMIVKDTIEEKILELQEAKQDLADAILEGRSESLMSLSSEELLELLNG